MKRTKVWACENCHEATAIKSEADAHILSGHSMVVRRILGTVESFIADAKVTPWMSVVEVIDEYEHERRGERALASRER